MLGEERKKEEKKKKNEIKNIDGEAREREREKEKKKKKKKKKRREEKRREEKRREEKRRKCGMSSMGGEGGGEHVETHVEWRDSQEKFNLFEKRNQNSIIIISSEYDDESKLPHGCHVFDYNQMILKT